MAAIDRCSRCYEPLEEGIRRGIVIVCYPENPTNPPLHTMTKILCKKCMDSFFDWKEMKE